MTAYLISDITVRDPTAFEVYRTRAAGAIRTYGRYLARLGEVQVLEGSWIPNMIVVVEFPSLEQGLVRGIAQPSTHSPSRCTTKRSAAISFSLMR
jgi:uncharacterized protein (DUF1330 family)